MINAISKKKLSLASYTDTKAVTSTMAQHTHIDDTDHAKGKLGASCWWFNRVDRKWHDAVIVGNFSDEKGNWLKVQCESEIHVILNDDPDLRMVPRGGSVPLNKTQATLQKSSES